MDGRRPNPTASSSSGSRPQKPQTDIDTGSSDDATSDDKGPVQFGDFGIFPGTEPSDDDATSNAEGPLPFLFGGVRVGRIFPSQEIRLELSSDDEGPLQFGSLENGPEPSDEATSNAMGPLDFLFGGLRIFPSPEILLWQESSNGVTSDDKGPPLIQFLSPVIRNFPGGIRQEPSDGTTSDDKSPLHIRFGSLRIVNADGSSSSDIRAEQAPGDNWLTCLLDLDSEEDGLAVMRDKLEQPSDDLPKQSEEKSNAISGEEHTAQTAGEGVPEQGGSGGSGPMAQGVEDNHPAGTQQQNDREAITVKTQERQADCDATKQPKQSTGEEVQASQEESSGLPVQGSKHEDCENQYPSVPEAGEVNGDPGCRAAERNKDKPGSSDMVPGGANTENNEGPEESRSRIFRSPWQVDWEELTDEEQGQSSSGGATKQTNAATNEEEIHGASEEEETAHGTGNLAAADSNAEGGGAPEQGMTQDQGDEDFVAGGMQEDYAFTGETAEELALLRSMGWPGSGEEKAEF